MKQLIKKYFPPEVVYILEKIYLKFLWIPQYVQIKKMHKRYPHNLKRIREKDTKIKVIFMIGFIEEWNKFERVFQMFAQDKRYETKIYVCPIINMGQQYMFDKLKDTYYELKRKGYSVYNTKIEKGWIDVKRLEKPDIVFHNCPYEGQTFSQYYVLNFKDSLNCYIPYAFFNSSNKWWFDSFAQNLMWKVFGETLMHWKLAKKLERMKGKNWVVSGYTGNDDFLFLNHKIQNPWMEQEGIKKNIIWSPHHNKIENFIQMSDFMIDLANRYKDEIKVAFKPHPILKDKLYHKKGWGKEKTDRYYEQWNKMKNTKLYEGTYVDLFLTSDALIHDCGSFMTEYLCTLKPALYMISKEAYKDKLSQYGKQALSVHYHSHNQEEIEKFIKKVVLEEKDILKEKRIKFVNTVLKPNGEISSSEYIYKYINKQVFNEK